MHRQYRIDGLHTMTDEPAPPPKRRSSPPALPQARAPPPALPPAVGLRPEAPKAPSAALPATRPAPPPLPTPDPPADLVERLAVAEPPLSTAQKVLVVAEGGTFRAQLETGDGGLGLTLKATRDGRALVQALPAPVARARGGNKDRRRGVGCGRRHLRAGRWIKARRRAPDQGFQKRKY